MTNLFKFLYLITLLSFGKGGNCSDSTYIYIKWNREVDKPYCGFIFYKTGGYNPEYDDDPYAQNSFMLQIPLSENKLSKLKHLLFKSYKCSDTSYRSNPLYGSYLIAYFEGSNWVLSNFINSEIDFAKIKKLITSFFKRTHFKKIIKLRWKVIFSRLGLDKN